MNYIADTVPLASYSGAAFEAETKNNEGGVSDLPGNEASGFLSLRDLAHLAPSAWFTYRVFHILGLAGAFGFSIADVPERHEFSHVPADTGLVLSHAKATILEQQRLSSMSHCASYIPPSLFRSPAQPSLPIPSTATDEQPECKQQ